MQFVRNGPDIPECLLQAHEEGRVVFFCGAGISFSAGLPSFDELCRKLYEALAIEPNAVQQAACKAQQFDVAIGLLEQSLIGERGKVREKLANILKPDLNRPNATKTHDALLTLSKNREGFIRLITTNFDRLFEQVISDNSLCIKRFQAPLLPIPKNLWDGLVYLHGLLDDPPTSSGGDRLILSSGDFGRAYLTERWASRFVSELFRRYTVCFVGYSINDPVLRYMMDALAADRLLGESSPEMFAFGSHSKSKAEECANEWRAKNVTPILYREYRSHYYLRKTLWEWAKTYRDGIRGKERIVVESATARPLGGTKEDYFIPRMLWALSDSTRLPSARFAGLDPVPSLEWREPLSQLEPMKRMVSANVYGDCWDPVMCNLARWLTRHLDDPELLLWLVGQDGQLQGELINRIERRLSDLDQLEREEKTAELERIRKSAPKAIAGPPMRTLWRLLLAERLQRSPRRDLNFYHWRDRFKRDGLTAAMRFELREILTPRVSLSKPICWRVCAEHNRSPERIEDLVSYNLVLSANYVHSCLQQLGKDECWVTVLPDLLQDFTLLLHDALDLMRELGHGQRDLSCVYQPSISKHTQNRGFRDWTALIDLVRDSWLEVAKLSPERASLAVESWWHVSYPLFKRLAFFAAAQDGIVAHRRALDWMLADGRRWLWSDETRREIMRLLVTLAPQLDEALLETLEREILIGPPREMYRDDMKPERWAEIVDKSVWLRLAKITQAGAVLSVAGEERLDALSTRHPEWKLTPNQCDEFPYWMYNSNDGEPNPWRTFTRIPSRRRGMLDYLMANPVLSESQQDDWQQRCDESFQATAYALCHLAKKDHWPSARWRDALVAWSSDERLQHRSWRYMGSVLADAPDSLLEAITHDLSHWLRTVAKVFEDHEAQFFKIASRILTFDHPNVDNNDSMVTQAINHPVGRVTEALLHWWHRPSLKDGQGLPKQIKANFTALCNAQIEKFCFGRVVLAAHVVTLFRVDGDWAKQYVLPLFDWQRSEIEARAAWQGFLWASRLYYPLMKLIKTEFLETADHYGELGGDEIGGFNKQYAALLAFAALDPRDIFKYPELAIATQKLPEEGLCETIQTLTRSLQSAGDRQGEYWSNRIKPYLCRIWPKTRHHLSPSIAENLGQLCIAAADDFPAAFKQLKSWLQPIDYPCDLVSTLYNAGLCKRFPQQAHDFLKSIVSDGAQCGCDKLKACVQAIQKAAPDLEIDQGFDHLKALEDD